MSTVINFNDDKYGKLNKLGITSYEHKERAYEPQTQNTFTFQFLFDPGQVEYIRRRVDEATGSTLTGKKTIPKGSDGLAKINEYLNVSMQSIQSPTKNIGQIVIDFFNSQVKFAGKPTYSEANITLNTLIGIQTKNILSAWSGMCQEESSLAGGWARSDGTITSYAQAQSLSDSELFSHIGYKVDGILLECARDGSIVNQWDYIGCWLKSFTPGSFSMSGANSPSQVSGTISVDLIRQSSLSFVKKELNY